MRTLAVLGLVMVVLTGLHGCKKKPAATTQQQRGDSPHQKFAMETIAWKNELAAILDSVQDEASARAAIPKLRQMGVKLEDFQKRLRELGEPSPEEDERLER